MAAAGFVNVIGVVSGFATLIGFGTGFVDAPAAIPGHSKVRIVTGLPSDETGLGGPGGDMPVVTGYNNAGEEVGTNNMSPIGGGHIDDGTGSTTQIGQGDHTGQQVMGIDIKAGKDGICVAVVSIEWPEEVPGTRAWLGDAGVECGQRWYPSKIIVNDDDYEPACTWLDADHTDGTVSSGVYIHFPDFYVEDGGSVDNEDPTSYCELPAMEFRNDGGDKRRRGPPMKREFNNLVVHNSTRFAAEEVCAHPNAHGPDYVSFRDGKHCNMVTREVLPLCGGGVEGEECFDLDGTNAGVEHGIRKRSALGYEKVFNWGH